MTEGLDQRIHATTHVQMISAIVLRDIDNTWDARQFFFRHKIAKLDRYSLPGPLPQFFYLLNGHQFTTADDRDTLAHLLHIAHDMRTHKNGLPSCLLFQQQFVENSL